MIEGDVAKAVRRLKQGDGKDILVNGSGALVRTLVATASTNCVSWFTRSSSAPEFGCSAAKVDQAELTLADSRAYANGVIGLTYRPMTTAGHEE